MSSIGGLHTSILKAKSRDLIRESINRVRFELLANRSLHKVLLGVESEDANCVRDYNDYLRMISDECISEADFLSAVQESRECCDLLTKYRELAHALMRLDWLRQPAEAVAQWQLFLVDLLTAQNKYTKFAVRQLVGQLVPREIDEYQWRGGRPSTEQMALREQRVLETIGRVLEVIPYSRSILLVELRVQFPFYAKASYVYAGFLGAVIRLIEERVDLKAEVFRLVLNKLIVLDCYTPREDIDLAEDDSDVSDDEDDDSGKAADSDEMFEMELDSKPAAAPADAATATAPAPTVATDQMKSPQAETLDLCMEQLFNYLQAEHKRESRTKSATSATFSLLLDTFENILLPAHNTHHVQFVLFYYTSFSGVLAEQFVQQCWQRLRDLNAPTPIRQTAVGYLASALSRSLFIGVDVVQEYLQEMCTWIRMYIKRSDAAQSVYTVKAHGPFFATCQALFYVISFRSRELTAGSLNLRFLQSLQLNAIVTSPLNPLRVCQPAVATAFSGVTRAHQLAYCHTILERNARKRLATITANDLLAPVETLDTFFPFDQYMLKKSGRRIAPIYRLYQASEAEEQAATANGSQEERHKKRRNAAGETETTTEDDDVDFCVKDKRCKIMELSKSFDRDLQFYNISTTPKM